MSDKAIVLKWSIYTHGQDRRSQQAGGWMVRASLLGGMVRTFYVYELEDNKAAELAQIVIAATCGEVVEAVRLLEVHELEDHGLKPGDVKQFI